MSIIVLIVSLFVATELVVGRSAFKATPKKTCAWCDSPVGKNPWNGRDTVLNLQKVCNPCWDKASEYDMKWGH